MALVAFLHVVAATYPPTATLSASHTTLNNHFLLFFGFVRRFISGLQFHSTLQCKDEINYSLLLSKSTLL